MAGVLMSRESSRSGRLPIGLAKEGRCDAGITPEGKEIFRLEIGIFYEPPRLGRAIGDLLAGSFRKRELCLAGTREPLGSVRAFAVPRRQLRPLYPLAPHIEVMTTSGVLLRKLLKEAAWRERESKFASAWLLPELFGNFTEHIRANAIVLLASAPDPSLQHQAPAFCSGIQPTPCKPTNSASGVPPAARRGERAVAGALDPGIDPPLQ